jgi:hypothetical protein
MLQQSTRGGDEMRAVINDQAAHRPTRNMPSASRFERSCAR